MKIVLKKAMLSLEPLVTSEGKEEQNNVVTKTQLPAKEKEFLLKG